MTYKLVWLPLVLRNAGLRVVEEPQWTTRGHGDMGTVRGVLCHHTAGPRTGNTPSLRIVRDGRPGLSGPLAQLFLARDGTYYVVAAGLAYHAGGGYWLGITAGNSSFVGVEAENTGLANDQPWPAGQMDAYARGCAAILAHIGAPSIMCVGHSEYAKPAGRKVDPSFDMKAFRIQVATIMGDHRQEPDPQPVDGPKYRVVGVTPDTLTFRDGPAGDAIGVLPEGVVVTRIGEDGKWMNVVTPAGFKGWVAARFLGAAG
jgi:hypothetical protein